VLKSWAVPKGIPSKRGIRRLAVAVEDHPMEWGDFEGTIPEGEYGAGAVEIYDRGTYAVESWTDQKIVIDLEGTRVRGKYALIRFQKAGGNNWLLFSLEQD
jgi:bifunctional non-homologous end joining protein LigD